MIKLAWSDVANLFTFMPVGSQIKEETISDSASLLYEQQRLFWRVILTPRRFHLRENQPTTLYESATTLSKAMLKAMKATGVRLRITQDTHARH
ncbi:MAG: hypothetical protein KUG79_12335 [Pseudomonadales bacterium]|nr:hypothetical protein [Pseudomonadales bacterium]